ETGADDQDVGVVFTGECGPSGQAIRAAVGVVAGDMLRGLLEHTSLMKLCFYNFMKNYRINFIWATSVIFLCLG
ncbi:hypothetical protein SB861_62065, partial [Paraburkholderia sp. SIMBA_049]